MNDCTYSTKIIAFDLDDTLYQEIDFVMSGYRAVSRFVEQEYGYADAFAVLSDAYSKHQNPFDALALAMKPTDINIDRLVDIYRNHKPEISLSRATEATLQYLQGEDAVLCLITDGRSTTQRNKIEALGLTRFFDDENISISEEIGVEKTDRLPFDNVMKRFPEARQFYYIGDNTAKDFFWPNRLKWTTICIEDHGQNIHPQVFTGDRMHNPQIIVDSVYDVPSIILD